MASPGPDQRNSQEEDSRKRQLAEMLKHVQAGAALASFAERREWDRLVSSAAPPEFEELLTELARFAHLWRYFQEREEKLGQEIVGHLGRVHRLSVPERVVELKEINRRLIRRVIDAGTGTQSGQ